MDALWNQYRAVQKRPAEYEKIGLRLQHKKRNYKPLTMKRKRKEVVSKLPKRGGSWGATGKGMQHDFAVLGTRRASENSPVKNYPKKQGSRSGPEVDVDVCIIDIWDSPASRTLNEVLASEEGWEVVRVADRIKTEWCVCMYTAIAAVVTAAGTRPKDWAKVVQKKASSSFAITNRKCKHMISATASEIEKNPMLAAHKRFPWPTYVKAYAKIMAGAKEPSFGLSMANYVPVLFQALMSAELYDGEPYEVWGPKAQGWVEEGSSLVRFIEPHQCLDYLLCLGRKPQSWLREGAEILLVVGPADTGCHTPNTLRPGAEEGETTEKQRVPEEPTATQAVPAAVEVEEFGEMEEETEEWRKKRRKKGRKRRLRKGRERCATTEMHPLTPGTAMDVFFLCRVARDQAVPFFCMLPVLLEYSTVVATPYIDISGQWMMLFFCLFATDQAVLLFVESRRGLPSFFACLAFFSAR